MKRILLCLLFASAVRADIVVPAVEAGKPFELRIDARSPYCTLPSNPRLFIAGKTILVTFEAGEPCPFEAVTPPWQASIAMPGLAAGTYHVEVRIVGSTAFVFEARDFTVSGTAPGIEISPAFDANAGNRVIRIRGSFPGAIPTVFFGNKTAEGVERISDTELHALVPFQTNVRVVDVTVRGDNYNYVLPSGFTYVGNDYRPIILPVYTNRAVPGAFGSLWQTEFRFVNLSQLTFIPGIDILYMDGDFPSGQVKSPKLTTPRDDVVDPPIAVAWIRRELAPFVSAELRVRVLVVAAERGIKFDFPFLRVAFLQQHGA